MAHKTRNLTIFQLLSITILSALLFSAAFFFSESYGFLIIFSGLLLYINFFVCESKPLLKKMWPSFSIGFVWGLVAYGLHFLWLYELLVHKSCARYKLALFLYVFIIVYFSFTSALWFSLTTFFVRLACKICVIKTIISVCVISIITGIYFWLLGNYALWFMGVCEGYPCLNPAIPLARYKIFLRFVSCLYGLMPGANNINYTSDTQNFFKLYDFVYLKPAPELQTQNKQALEQYVYHKIIKQDTKLLLASNKTRGKVFVAPESFFPYPLNKYPETITFWSNALPHASHLLMGSFYQEENKSLCHCVYHIFNGKIINCYKKKHSVFFVEKMPPFFKKCTILRNMFLKNVSELSVESTCDKKTIFTIGSMQIISQICSEFFLQNNVQDLLYNIQCNDKCDDKRDYKDICIFFYANDSWFVDYFKKIMENLVYLKMAQLRIPIIFINHTLCKEIWSE